jgi:hydrophobe/amphiphile efflux-3 (HAE3) family protein
MSFFETRYLQLQSALERYASAMLVFIFLVFAISSSGVLSLHLDMSFRPLFASGADISEPTEEFEGVFGQSSGAWIVAILENDGSSTPEFIRTTARLSDLTRNIPHVSEVLSITALRIPQWHRGRLSFAAAIPEYLLEPEEQEELEDQYEALLDGTRFVNWLISADGSRLMLGARLDLPLEDLDGRREVVNEFKTLLSSEAPDDLNLYFTGVSVVELAYEHQVLRDQVIATVLTTAVLILLLYWSFGRVRSVLVCLTPVLLAIPATLGVMGWLGLPLIIINTAVPAIVLVIGIADAVHMLNAWLEARENGEDQITAARTMLEATGKACFFTTVTTMGGFLALYSAKLTSVANFGLAVATGIFIAWLANQTLLPWMLRHINAGNGLPAGRVNRLADKSISRSMRYAIDRPGRVLIVSLLCTAACCAMIPFLDVDQKFNEELPEAHPIIRAQTILERDFGGFLGPEISIRRNDGKSLIDDNSLRQLGRFVSALRELPETRHVWSVQDILPRPMVSGDRAAALDAMRMSPDVRERVKELINPDYSRLAVIVRIGDVGTHRAGEFHAEVEQAITNIWGEEYDVEIVGQWWLAQHGMRLVLRDMLVSLATAMLIVLPLMWIALRELRLFFAAAVANLLPLVLPLALMAATAITLRIGTAVVLAIALGIVVDNTLHIIIRLRARATGEDVAPGQVDRAMRGTGRAVIFTTLALVGGFLSMLSNQLLAIRDMGLVAAVTIGGAMFADLLVVPALYILLTRNRITKQESERLSRGTAA